MRTKRICFSLALMAVCAAIMGLECFLAPDPYFDVGGRYWWQDAAIALWPLVMGGAALALSRLMAGYRRRWLCLLYPAYFAIAGLGIMLLEWHHLPWRAFEICETVYLILATDIALFSVSIDGLAERETAALIQYLRPHAKKVLLTRRLEIYFFSAVMKQARLASTLAANIAAAVMLTQHDRLWDILFGRTGLGNWLHYRQEAFSPDIPWLPVGLAAAAFVLIFLLKETLPLEHRAGYLYGTLAFSLLARSILGLVCRLFSVVSSELQVLLQGEMWDIISIAALLALVPLSVKSKEKEDDEFRKWLRLGTSSALDAAMPPPAAHAPRGSAPGQARLYGRAAGQDTRQDPGEA